MSIPLAPNPDPCAYDPCGANATCHMTGNSTHYCDCPDGTNGTSCKPPACLKKADLVFILDASGSVGKKNWKKQVDFVISVVSRMKIGPDAVQVGLVIFSTKATVTFELNEHKTAEKVANIQRTVMKKIRPAVISCVAFAGHESNL